MLLHAQLQQEPETEPKWARTGIEANERKPAAKPAGTAGQLLAGMTTGADAASGLTGVFVSFRTS